MTVKVAVPVEINDSILTSSGIPEPDPSVGEVAWLEQSSKEIAYNLSSQSGDTVRYHMTRNLYGELLVVISRAGGVWGVAKFGADNSLIWSQNFSTDTGVDGLSLKSLGCGIEGDTMILYWYVDDNALPEHKHLYEQRITDIAGQGSFPLAYTSSAIHLSSFPTSITDNAHVRISRSEGSIFAAYSNNNSGFLSDISISRADLAGNVQDTVTAGFINGNVRAITSDNSGGVYLTIDGDYLDGKLTVQNYNSQLSKNDLGKVDYGFGLISQVGYFGGIISIGIPPGGGGLEELDVIPYSTNLVNDGSYKKGDEVVYLPNHIKYICLANETFSNPSETATGDANAEWLKIGPSNRWSMLDKFIKNKTKSTVDFTVEITPGVLFDTVSFFGIIGVDTIRVEVLRGVDVIYDETKSFVDLNSIVDWYSYFFYQLTHREEDVFFNIPPYLDTKLRVTFTGTGSGIEVGAMPFGMSQTMGVVCINTKSDTKDYSDIEYDQFGELSEIERPVVSYNTYEIDVKKTLAKSIERKLKDLRGKNALWVGDIGDGQQLITYGRYERSPLTYSNHSIVSYSVKVRGSI